MLLKLKFCTKYFDYGVLGEDCLETTFDTVITGHVVWKNRNKNINPERQR